MAKKNTKNNTNLIDDMYEYYKKRKQQIRDANPLKEISINNNVGVIKEYKPISAGMLQRKKTTYTAMYISPFEPVNDQKRNNSIKNPLIIENTIDKKPLIDFSFLEWARAIGDFIKRPSFATKGYGESKYSQFAVYRIDSDFDGILDKDEKAINRESDNSDIVLNINEADSSDDGVNDFIKNKTLNENKEWYDKYLYLGIDNSGLILTNYSTYIFEADKYQSLRDLYVPYFLTSIFSEATDGNGLSTEELTDFITGYYPFDNIFDQYTLMIDSIFLFKHKNFYDRSSASDINLIFETELNREIKESVLNLPRQNVLFDYIEYDIIDDKERTDNNDNQIEVYREKNIVSTPTRRYRSGLEYREFDIDFVLVKKEFSKKINCPIIRLNNLETLDIKNNFVIANNYLNSEVFKTTPIGSLEESTDIIFSQEELVDAKYRKWENYDILNGSVSIVNDTDNSFKSVLLKYLVKEIENVIKIADLEDVNEDEDGNLSTPVESISNVLIPMLMIKIESLFERGVLFKCNNINMLKNDDTKYYADSLNLNKYTVEKYFFVVKDEEENYLTNLYDINGDKFARNYTYFPATGYSVSISELRILFYKMFYYSISSFLRSIILDFTYTNVSQLYDIDEDQDLEDGLLRRSFTNEFSEDFELFLKEKEDLLPNISIVYSVDNAEYTNSGIHSPTGYDWSSIISFLRKEHMRSVSLNSEDVIKLKSFINIIYTNIYNKSFSNPIYSSIFSRLENLGPYSIDLIEGYWKIKDNQGNTVNSDYFNLVIQMFLIEYGIINEKTLSKTKNKQSIFSFLKESKEEDLENIKKSFIYIKNTFKKTLDFFSTIYNPWFSVNDIVSNDKTVLNKGLKSLKTVFNKTALVSVKGQIGLILNFEPLVCYSFQSNMEIFGELRDPDYALELYYKKYNLLFPIVYPLASKVIDANEESDIIPGVYSLRNLWEPTYKTYSSLHDESTGKFNGYNFKNLPALSSLDYILYGTGEAPFEGSSTNSVITLIDKFVIVNDLVNLEEKIDLTEIFYKAEKENNKIKLNLNLTDTSDIDTPPREISKDILKNKTNLTLGIPVLFISEKVNEPNNITYFTNRESLISLDDIESIYFFEEKDYNPHIKEQKKSKQNTAYSIKAK